MAKELKLQFNYYTSQSQSLFVTSNYVLYTEAPE